MLGLGECIEVDVVVESNCRVCAGPSSKSGQDEKATDDFHYEKFKKQMRRFWRSNRSISRPDVCNLHKKEQGLGSTAGTELLQIQELLPLSQWNSHLKDSESTIISSNSFNLPEDGVDYFKRVLYMFSILFWQHCQLLRIPAFEMLQEANEIVVSVKLIHSSCLDQCWRKKVITSLPP